MTITSGRLQKAELGEGLIPDDCKIYVPEKMCLVKFMSMDNFRDICIFVV